CIFTLFLGLGFCGTALADTADFSGDWQGTWTSVYSVSGNLSASVTQSETTLSGTLGVTNTDCGNFDNLSLTGTVSCNVATFEASAYCTWDGSNNTLEYTDGVLSENTITGNYFVYSDGSFYDAGSFILTRLINTVTASAGTGGTISPSGSVSVNSGANQTFTITPNTGYSVSEVQVDGSPIQAVASYTFTNVTSNHTIAVSFKPAVIAGDINNNGNLDLQDSILALQVVAGIPLALSIHKNTDVNGNQRIGLAEVIYIMQRVAGLRPQ
ncbi:hypothetical protein KA005_67275, partial [bacterium]|nr:hypothetical protein [bacterium]